MGFLKYKSNTIFFCSIVAVLAVGLYLAYVVNTLILMGNTKIPNMKIEIKNASNIDVNYSVHIEGKRPVQGELKKNIKSEIKVVYAWNLTDKLNIKMNDKNGKLICNSRPNLKITRQHLYNPNIKYQLMVTFKNNQVYVEQIK